MQLDDVLQICLLSIASRYPVHTMDFNEEVLALPGLETRGWTAQEMIEFFDSYAPQLLQAPATLLVDGCSSEILVPMYSEDCPTIYVHCRGKIPTPHEKSQINPVLA